MPPRSSTKALAKVISLQNGLARASALAQESDTENTRRAYRAAMKDWLAYCEAVDVKPFPADIDVVKAWLGHLEEEGYSVSAMRHRMVALNRLHRDRGVIPPGDHQDVKKTIKGYVRRHAGDKRPRASLSPKMVRDFLKSDALLLDKTVIAVGLVTGLRRSELVALRWKDVKSESKGVVLKIPRSKTDQESKGAFVGIPYGPNPKLCPARLLEALQKQSKSEHVFPICVDTINNMVKRVAKLAGEDPKDYGAHSLRAGMATASGEADVPLQEVMRASRHKSADVAASYFRQKEVLKNRAFVAVVNAISEED